MPLGHPGLITPYNTTEFHAMTEALRKHHRAMKSQMGGVVGELRPALAELPGRRGMLGADSKVAAYRVCRQFTHVIGLNGEIITAYARAYDLYEELFLNRGNGPRPKFDPNA